MTKLLAEVRRKSRVLLIMQYLSLLSISITIYIAYWYRTESICQLTPLLLGNIGVSMLILSYVIYIKQKHKELIVLIEEFINLDTETKMYNVVSIALYINLKLPKYRKYISIRSMDG